MALKDAMRDRCLVDLAEAWLQLIASLRSTNTRLAAAVLDVVARYINWIDIGLVANDRLVLSYCFAQLLSDIQ